jgi:DHA2 family multidrug resistance protein
VRLFGGSIGGVVMAHFIAQREKLHSNLLGLHVQGGNWIADQGIHQTTAGFSAKSAGLAAATGRAVDLLSARLRLQAYTLTFIDGFYLVAWVCVLSLLVTALLRKAPLQFEDLAALQPHSALPEESKS